MTREQCLFLAKKMYVELVYNTAYIEGVNVTFPQTQTIIDGGVVNNVAVSDIQTILNLRDAWKFILDSVDAPLNLEYVCKVNEYVSRNESLEWGKLRNGNVCVSGTDYIPELPETDKVIAALEQINAIEDPTERAMEYFCYAVHAQLFWDGNKRTSTMIASKILMQNSIGVLTIDAKNSLAFNEGLHHFYNTGDKEPLISALKGCIKTLDIQPELNKSKRISERLKEKKVECDRLNSERSITRTIPDKDRGR